MWFESKLYEELKEQQEYTTLQDCLNENPLYEHLKRLLLITLYILYYLDYNHRINNLIIKSLPY